MAHENLYREEEIEGSSDRSFGLVFAAVFLVIGLLPLLGGHAIRWWSIGVSVAFAAVALVAPALLSGLNRWWLKLGLLLSAIVSPVALGLLFYLAIAPIGLVMRMVGADPLRLKRDRAAKSYWIPREPPGPPPQSMNNQF